MTHWPKPASAFDSAGRRRTAWPVAAEQVAVVRLLNDPQTHGGKRPAYVETALSHIFCVGDITYILKRPMRIDGGDWRTPEARWAWCEDQCLAEGGHDILRGRRLVPVRIARRAGGLHLGGPGELEDCVLRREKIAAADADGAREHREVAAACVSPHRQAS